MKIRTLAAAVGLLVATTACTPQEVRFWRTYHAAHPAEAEEALIAAGLADEAAQYQPTPSTTPAPYDPAARINYPNPCAVKVPIDQQIYAGIVSPGRVVWFVKHSTFVFGYSRTEGGKIYDTEECLTRSPD